MEDSGLIPYESRALTAREFHELARVPHVVEWFANIRNKNTRKAYQRDVKEFMDFIGLREPDEFRLVTRAHVIAWRKSLEAKALGESTIRRKLSALSSLFDELCEKNALPHNPVTSIERPKANNNIGMTPAISDEQAKALIEAPPANTLKGIRDRAILATLAYHGLRRDEFCRLTRA